MAAIDLSRARSRIAAVPHGRWTSDDEVAVVAGARGRHVLLG